MASTPTIAHRSMKVAQDWHQYGYRSANDGQRDEALARKIARDMRFAVIDELDAFARLGCKHCKIGVLPLKEFEGELFHWEKVTLSFHRCENVNIATRIAVLKGAL